MAKKHEEKPTVQAEPQQALATTGTDALAKIDFASDLVSYKDEFDKTALQIPFLRILQSNSPVCTRGESSYNEDARPGMYYNTVSGELSRRLEVIPVYHYSTLIEWRPRNEGGGFVKDHGFEGGMRALATCRKRKDGDKETNRDMLPNGNDLIRTEVYFVLVVKEDGGLEQAMITMVSTQLKKARNWNSRFRMKVNEVPGVGRIASPPMFFNTYRLSTAPEKNDFGNWEGFVIEDGRPTLSLGDTAYLAAKDFRQTCEEGIRSGKISLDKAEEESKPEMEETPF